MYSQQICDMNEYVNVLHIAEKKAKKKKNCTNNRSGHFVSHFVCISKSCANHRALWGHRTFVPLPDLGLLLPVFGKASSYVVFDHVPMVTVFQGKEPKCVVIETTEALQHSAAPIKM